MAPETMGGTLPGDVSPQLISPLDSAATSRARSPGLGNPREANAPGGTAGAAGAPREPTPALGQSRSCRSLSPLRSRGRCGARRGRPRCWTRLKPALVIVREFYSSKRASNGAGAQPRTAGGALGTGTAGAAPRDALGSPGSCPDRGRWGRGPPPPEGPSRAGRERSGTGPVPGGAASPALPPPRGGAEPSRAEPSRAERSRAEPSRAERSRVARPRWDWCGSGGGCSHGAEPGGCLRLLEGAGGDAGGAGHGAPQQQHGRAGLVLRGVQCQRWPCQRTEQHRLALVLHGLWPHRPLFQPLCPLRPGQLLPQALQPGPLLLPHLPLRAGGHRLHGAAGDSLGHHPLPLHQVLLGQGRPWLPPLQLPRLLHGLLWAVPAAAGGHHGRGALLGHQPPLLPLHQPLQAPRLGHRGAGVGLLLLSGTAAGVRAGALHAAVPRLLVLPHPPAQHWRRRLLPALCTAGHPLRAALLRPQHRQRGHALPRLPRPRVGAAAPRQRGGDDGAARGHHDHRHHLLDAPPDLHCPDGPAAAAWPGPGAAHGHAGDAADLHPHGHLEPDPGPLGVHPVPPGRAAACVPPAAPPALHRLPQPLPAPQAHRRLRPAVAPWGWALGRGTRPCPAHPRWILITCIQGIPPSQAP